jgi:hypothetical protein
MSKASSQEITPGLRFVRGVALRPEACSKILLTDTRPRLTPIFVS